MTYTTVKTENISRADSSNRRDAWFTQRGFLFRAMSPLARWAIAGAAVGIFAFTAGATAQFNFPTHPPLNETQSHAVYQQGALVAEVAAANVEHQAERGAVEVAAPAAVLVADGARQDQDGAVRAREVSEAELVAAGYDAKPTPAELELAAADASGAVYLSEAADGAFADSAAEGFVGFGADANGGEFVRSLTEQVVGAGSDYAADFLQRHLWTMRATPNTAIFGGGASAAR